MWLTTNEIVEHKQTFRGIFSIAIKDGHVGDFGIACRAELLTRHDRVRKLCLALSQHGEQLQYLSLERVEAWRGETGVWINSQRWLGLGKLISIDNEERCIFWIRGLAVFLLVGWKL